MENNMVAFDNHFLSSLEGIKLVKSLFEKSLDEYIVESEYDESIYWQIIYVKGDIKIMFGSGRGILEYFIEKDHKMIDMTEYKPCLKDALIASSDNNIRFVFDAMANVLQQLQKNDVSK